MNVEFLKLYRDKKYKRWNAVVYTKREIMLVSSLPRYKKYCYYSKKNGCLTGFDYRGLRMCLYNEYGIELPKQDDLILVYSETENPYVNNLVEYYACVGIPYIYPVLNGNMLVDRTGCY